MQSPPKPLDEIQLYLECELLTWMGRATLNFFLPRSLGPEEGWKGQIFNVNYKVNFKDFYTKLCACSLHKWKIQVILDGIFILLPGSCPRGGTLGRWGCPSGQQFICFQTWSCSISNQRGWRAEQNALKFFILELNWWPWNEIKG